MTRILWSLLVVALLSWAWSEADAITPKEVIKICEHYKYSRCKLLTSIAIWETRGSLNPMSYNPKEDAYGIFQMKCRTAKSKEVGLKYSCSQLHDPKIAVRFAVRYLESLEKRGYLLDRHIIAAHNSGGVYFCKKLKKNGWLKSGMCLPGRLINRSYVNEVSDILKYLKETV